MATTYSKKKKSTQEELRQLFLSVGCPDSNQVGCIRYCCRGLAAALKSGLKPSFSILERIM